MSIFVSQKSFREYQDTVSSLLHNHKHCPICGRMIDAEDITAYFHIFMPTVCKKDMENK